MNDYVIVKTLVVVAVVLILTAMLVGAILWGPDHDE